MKPREVEGPGVFCSHAEHVGSVRIDHRLAARVSRQKLQRLVQSLLSDHGRRPQQVSRSDLVRCSRHGDRRQSRHVDGIQRVTQQVGRVDQRRERLVGPEAFGDRACEVVDDELDRVEGPPAGQHQHDVASTGTPQAAQRRGRGRHGTLDLRRQSIDGVALFERQLVESATERLKAGVTESDDAANVGEPLNSEGALAPHSLESLLHLELRARPALHHVKLLAVEPNDRHAISRAHRVELVE